MKIAFRADASARAGAGHVMRCLALAQRLRDQGAQPYFICREHPGNLISLLERNDMPVRGLVTPMDEPPGNDYAAWLGVPPAEDAAHTVAALDCDRPDWLIVDNYGLNVEWERLLRPHVGRIMAIDDLANRHHDCDVLLDQNFAPRSDRRYSAFVTPLCKLLLGPSYALLRKEFAEMRSHLAPRQHKLEKIMVFITAGDDQGETLKAMQGLALFGKAEQVDVVIGSANPHAAQIKAMCALRRWTYHCEVDNMARLISQADLVIGAGGSSNWERCALGVPALVVILADNQAPIARALGRAGITHTLGWCRDLRTSDYADALAGLDARRLAAMSRKSLELVDAKGTERTANILLAA